MTQLAPGLWFFSVLRRRVPSEHRHTANAACCHLGHAYYIQRVGMSPQEVNSACVNMYQVSHRTLSSHDRREVILSYAVFVT